MQEALEQASSQSEKLTNENRLLRAERDLLKERLNKFLRKIFDAKSEVSSQSQKDMFFNEAEVLGTTSEPAAQEEAEEGGINVPAHKRAKRGRKPLDAALPREVVRYELPESERVCPHDGAALVEIAWRPASNSILFPSRCA